MDTPTIWEVKHVLSYLLIELCLEERASVFLNSLSIILKLKRRHITLFHIQQTFESATPMDFFK